MVEEVPVVKAVHGSQIPSTQAHVGVGMGMPMGMGMRIAVGRGDQLLMEAVIGALTADCRLQTDPSRCL